MAMLQAFAFVMVPTSMVMGFALATVGFTCWNLAVPLLLNLFQFHVFDALFLTVLMDLSGSLALVALYIRKGRVDTGFVLRFGPLCGAIAFTSAKLGEGILLRHQKLLKGTVGYIPFLYFLAFLAKARRSLKEEERAAAAAASAPPADGNGKWGKRVSGLSDEEGGALAAGLSGSTGTGSGSSSATPVSAAPASGERSVSHRRSSPDRDLGDNLDHVSGVWTTRAASPAFAWMVQTAHAMLDSPIIEAHRAHLSPAALRTKLGLCTLVVVLCGVLGGILYFGGGVIFVSVILALFHNDDLPLVTGTGCMMMASVCTGLLLSFVRRPLGVGSHLIPYAALVLPCVVLGTSVSSRAMLYMTKTSVLLLVSGVSLLMGVLITFQHQIFSFAADPDV